MTSVTQAITTALLQFIWQGTLLAAIVWWILTLLRRRSPGVRYAVGCVAMIVMVLLPAVTTYRVYISPVLGVAEASSPLLPAASTIVSGADAKPLSANWLSY